jgi:hypothetical protein
MFCPGRSENFREGHRVLTKITSYRTVGKKRSIARSYRKKTRGALLSLARAVILCNTPEHVDAAAGLAQAVSGEGMNNRNYLLFLMLLETNNPCVIDVLLGPRNPFLLFSPIKPNWFLLKETFRILAKFKGNELSLTVLLALMGVVQNAYKASKDGYKIYPLKISDIYSIGKHLDKDRDQLEPRNRLLLEILFDIYFVGIDSEDRATKQIGIKANDIRMTFFDHTKRMIDAIPDVLLVKDVVRDVMLPKRFQWTSGETQLAALEAREEPEIKLSLRAPERPAPLSRRTETKRVPVKKPAPRRAAAKATRAKATRAKTARVKTPQAKKASKSRAAHTPRRK